MLIPRSKWRRAQGERHRLSDQVHSLKRDITRLRDENLRLKSMRVRCAAHRCLRRVRVADLGERGRCPACCVPVEYSTTL